MNRRNAYESILGALYRATLDDAHWPAGSALLIGEGLDDDFRINFARLLRRGDNRQDVLREYFDTYYARDEGVRRIRRRSAGRLVRIPELYTEDERKHSPAYNEGWGLLGGRNGLNVHFDEPDGLRLVWAIGDPVDGGTWQTGQRRLIERLLPHVRQFVRMRQALAAAGAQDAGLTGLLDNSRIGVVHLDRGGRVVAANAQADFGGRRVAALLLLVDPALRPPIDPRWVAQRLGLTRSEGRVAALLAEGNTVAEIVSATGYRPGYLRQLLTRVYRKQGVSGQVALVPRVLAVDVLPRP